MDPERASREGRVDRSTDTNVARRGAQRVASAEAWMQPPPDSRSKGSKPGESNGCIVLFDDPIDAELADVVEWFQHQNGDLTSRFRGVVRRGIDEVIDGGRTGRWSIDQLAKTEKTYIGTKIEHLVLNEFEIPRGSVSTVRSPITKSTSSGHCSLSGRSRSRQSISSAC